MSNFSKQVNFIWSIADLIRDSFKRGKYQDVILPFTVLRRIDSVLAPTRQDVLATLADIGDQVENPHDLLCAKSGFAFYNTSRYDFDTLLGDAPQLAANLRNYIAGFSPNMREVIDRFDFDNTIKRLDEADLLYAVMERFKQASLHPQVVSNTEMGLIFEELIRKFNEASNENPGEHFTPREVIRLMVELLMARDGDFLQPAGNRRTHLRPLLRQRRHADQRQEPHPRAQPPSHRAALWARSQPGDFRRRQKRPLHDEQ